jgi:aryl-alcohol dehydrogenase-like predicted oxidoreductase
MQTRRYGRTEHESTVAVFGACAFAGVTQEVADAAIEQVIAAGVNHIDVAPSYGDAEERLGPWLARERERFFLNCKTLERTRAGAAAELRRSLQRLHVEHLDVYQFHAVNTLDELEKILQPGGALEAVTEARADGLVRFIGLTGHGTEAPRVFLEALRRFDFDTLMFPLNYAQYWNEAYRRECDELLRQCRAADVGTLIIKAVAQGPWQQQKPTHSTWYRPFIDETQIQRAVNFALSHEVSGLCTPSDTHLLPTVLAACENFAPLDDAEQQALIAATPDAEPLFV